MNTVILGTDKKLREKIADNRPPRKLKLFINIDDSTKFKDRLFTHICKAKNQFPRKSNIRQSRERLKDTIAIQIFDKTEEFVNQSYSFDLVISYLDQSDAIINCMKIMKNQKACFNYLCIGQSEQQLYKLYQIGICGFVYEKDIDEQLIPHLERILSETYQNGSEKLPF